MVAPSKLRPQTRYLVHLGKLPSAKHSTFCHRGHLALAGLVLQQLPGNANKAFILDMNTL